MRNAIFREIVQTRISSVSPSSVVRKKTVARRISVRNHNRLLWNFDGAIGGKTGYTAAAQKCFVGAVVRNGVTLIVSILGARDQWGDTKKLLEYGFDNYQTLKAATPPAGKPTSGEQVNIRPEPISTFAVAPEIDSKIRGANGYFLQVGAFRERDRAESLLKQVNEKGFNAFVERALLNKDQTTYRVRVGPYADLLQAQEIAGELLDRSGYQAVILPPP
jgi:D-alanyl-D-alanine carboxypeptidase